MSHAATTWAWAQQVKPHGTKLLLLAMADHAGADGLIFPSVRSLCIKTGLNRKAVIRGLNKLRGNGLIVANGEKRGRTKQIPVYVLGWSQVPDMERRNETGPKMSPFQKQTGPFVSPNRPHSGPETGPTMGLRNSKGTIKNKRGVTRDEEKSKAEEARASITRLLTSWGKG